MGKITNGRRVKVNFLSTSALGFANKVVLFYNNFALALHITGVVHHWFSLLGLLLYYSFVLFHLDLSQLVAFSQYHCIVNLKVI